MLERTLREALKAEHAAVAGVIHQLHGALLAGLDFRRRPGESVAQHSDKVP